MPAGISWYLTGRTLRGFSVIGLDGSGSKDGVADHSGINRRPAAPRQRAAESILLRHRQACLPLAWASAAPEVGLLLRGGGAFKRSLSAAALARSLLSRIRFVSTPFA